MKILRLLGFTILILGMILGNVAVAGNFLLRDLEGEYAFVDNGFITTMDPTTGQMQLIPTASVGQIVADRNGNGTAKAVMNIGGSAILNFESTSTTFTVDRETGLGTASSPVTLTAQPEAPLGTLPPGLDFSDESAVFDYSFVIDADGAFNIITTKLSAPDGTPLAAIVSRGIAKPQEPESSP